MAPRQKSSVLDIYKPDKKEENGAKKLLDLVFDVGKERGNSKDEITERRRENLLKLMLGTS